MGYLDNNGLEHFWNKVKLYVDEHSGSDEEVYSTEEIRIGTWIDGKPLYRKVFLLTTGSRDGSNILLKNALPNCGFFKCSGYFSNTYGNLSPIPYDDGTNRMNIYIENSTSGSIMSLQAGTPYRNCPLTAIIEYTKTTDY